MPREHNLHASVSRGFTSSPYFYDRSYKIQKTRKKKKKKKGKLLLYVDKSRPIPFAVRTIESSTCGFKHVSSYKVFSKLL